MAGHVYRRIRANFSAVAMAAMTFTAVACGGGGDAGGASVSAPPTVGSVNVTLANAQLQVGAQRTAAAEVRSTAGAELQGVRVIEIRGAIHSFLNSLTHRQRSRWKTPQRDQTTTSLTRHQPPHARPGYPPA